MRTTLEIPDVLFRKAQRVARARGQPFRALVAEALQRFLKEEEPAARYRLGDTTFGGDGLVDGLPDLHWERIRHLVHDEGEKE